MLPINDASLTTDTVPVDLIWTGGTDPPPWPHGLAEGCQGSCEVLGAAVTRWLQQRSTAYLVISAVPLPGDIEPALQLLGRGSADVLHAGVGGPMAHAPSTLEFVEPIWPLAQETLGGSNPVSWRMSPRWMMIRREVVSSLGFLRPFYDTINGAALELGHRYLRRGAIIRRCDHIAGDLSPGAEQPTDALTVHDELRFISDAFGGKWLAWAALRYVRHHPAGALKVAAALRRIRSAPSRNGRPTLPRTRPRATAKGMGTARVSVLVPTLERYPYLCGELRQLRNQSHRPAEIIVVDQTRPPQYVRGWEDEFLDLPLRVIIQQDVRGQCHGWNRAIREAIGDVLILLGDDADAIPQDLIEQFLRTMEEFGADMVACRVDEVGVAPPPERTQFLRISDTLPIAAVRARLFEDLGLYDDAFNYGARADADLLIRWIQAGALPIYDPSIRVVHLRAPRGGLRAHGARVVTRAASRQSVFAFEIPSATEFYLALKHFPASAVRELVLQRWVGSLITSGTGWRRAAKAAVGLLMLPITVFRTRRSLGAARSLLARFGAGFPEKT